MNIIKSVWGDIKEGKNIDVYSALVLGIVATFIGIFGGALEIVVAITSGTLALIAFGMLSSRGNSEKILEALNRLEQNLTNTKKIAIRDTVQPEIREIIINAKEELLVLLRTGSTVKAYQPEIEEVVKRGCSVRIIICDQSDATIKLLAYRGYSLDRPEDILRELQNTSANLLSLAKRSSGNPKNGTIQIRTIAYVPSIVIFLADPKSLSGKTYSEFTTFRSASDMSPGIKITKSQDAQIFEFVYTQFENYWNAANSISI